MLSAPRRGILAAMAILAPLAVNATAPPESPGVERLRTASANAGADRVPDDAAIDAWLQARDRLGLGDHSIAAADPRRLATALRSLAETPDALDRERALLSAEVDIGELDAWTADRWRAVLDAARTFEAPNTAAGDEPSAAELPSVPQLVVWTALAVRGSAAALLPPACMPDDPGPALAVAEALEPTTYRAPVATDGSAPPDRCSDPTADIAVQATCTFAAVADHAATGRAYSAAPCDLALVDAAARWSAYDDPAAVLDGLLALHETRFVPAGIARRAATRWYLQTDAAPLDALADAQERAGASPREVAMLRLLAAGAANAVATLDPSIRATELGGDAYSAWVDAERLRLTGDPTRAIARAEAALAVDPAFAAATLSHASSLIADGRADDAFADLEHLRRLDLRAPELAYWVLQLGERLR
ncbi:MAG: hypothetical protein H6700_12055 [Myxococcales bacterium]|nr:hypothetical protein [Myxococcales bacterium]